MRQIATLVLTCLLAAPLLAAAPSPAPAPAPAPIPAADAPKHMTVPDGFNVTLFAGEPDVVQPIAFTFDDRGRLWVAECLTYPEWNTDATADSKGKDRITVFEDTDGDGRFDKRTVFADDLVNLSGLELGFGGVYVCSMPFLKFIPADFNADVPKPTGPAQVLLDGWNTKQAGHNVVNGLTWGPDGWLYGLNGIQSKSAVGKPGTPDEQRAKFDCGMWRYQPTRHEFEVVCVGTTNPFGLDFDEYGQAFFTNCVIKHLWHAIPGAHFQRMYGQDYTPNIFQPMESCADHIHWGGGAWTESRSGQGKHSEAGGGHAHVGAMIYLGDNWPDSYRNTLFTCNLHGNRVNNDVLERTGSGYVAHHGKDFLFANDPWFRGISIRYGPDGGVYVSDWTDTGECHNHKEVDRSNGRVYKVTYGKANPPLGDLAKRDDAQLLGLLDHRNAWVVRHAQRLLQERASDAKGMRPEATAALNMVAAHGDVRERLQSLWTAHACGLLSDEATQRSLADAEPYVRGWAIQLALEGRQPSDGTQAKLASLAASDPSPVVRLFLASGLQRLTPDLRKPVAANLLTHAEDAADQNLPLMYWYGIEPVVAADLKWSVEMLERAKVPLVREFIARRRVGDLPALAELLGRTDDAAVQRDVLRGVFNALSDRRHVDSPANWPAAYAKLAKSPDGEVRDKATALGLLFGDAEAIAATTKLVKDPKANATARRDALHLLVHSRAPGVDAMLPELLTDPAIAGAAIRGLAETGGDATPRLVLSRYAALPADAKQDAIQSLSTRPPFALALLDAIEAGTVPRADVSAFSVRQIAGLKDAKVKAKLEKVWGTVREASKDKAAQATKYKAMLTADELKKADLPNGRAVFARTCAACHTLFDAGGTVGPNLTGSQRANLDYVLENVLDPSAVVPKDYQMIILDTKDGRTLTGTLGGETDAAVTLRTPTENVVVPKDEIEKRKTSPLSMMPEGLLDAMKAEEVRDLVGYLASPQQIPLAADGAKTTGAGK